MLDECFEVAHLSTVQYDDRDFGLIHLIHWNFRHFTNSLHPIDDLSEHYMLSIQMWASFQSYEKLTGVAVATTVRHRQQSSTGMPSGEVFVDECPTVNGISAGATTASDVPALNHEVIANAVELGVEVVQPDVVDLPILASTQPTEVFGSLRRQIHKQLEGDATSLTGTDLNIQVHFGIGLVAHSPLIGYKPRGSSQDLNNVRVQPCLAVPRNGIRIVVWAGAGSRDLEVGHGTAIPYEGNSRGGDCKGR